MHSAMYAMTPCLYFCRTVANQYSEYCMETDEQLDRAGRMRLSPKLRVLLSGTVSQTLVDFSCFFTTASDRRNFLLSSQFDCRKNVHLYV